MSELIELVNEATGEKFLVDPKHLVKPEEPPLWGSLGSALAELVSQGVVFSYSTPGNPRGGKTPGLSETHTLTVGAGQNRQKVYATGEDELLRQASKILREFKGRLGPPPADFAIGSVATASSLGDALDQAEADAGAVEV